MTTETMKVDGEQSSAPATSAARWKWRSSEGGVLNAFSHVFLLVWALMVGVPLLWALWSSFKTSGDILTHPWSLPTHFQFDNWARAWSKANIGRYFLNTAFVVGFRPSARCCSGRWPPMCWPGSSSPATGSSTSCSSAAWRSPC